MADVQRGSLSEAVEATVWKASYDRNAKLLVSEKSVLSRIMVGTVPEFMGMKPEEAEKYIEGKPAVWERELPHRAGGEEHSGTRITGMDKESVTGEGTILYDILFHVLLPSTRERVKMILNIEIQKKYTQDIVPRGIFNCARMITGQLNREFRVPHYRKIKKVYSIWICMGVPRYAEGTTTDYHLAKKDLTGSFPEGKQRYDLMDTITICVPQDMDIHALEEYKRGDRGEEELWLHRFLSVLLSNRLSAEERKEILQNEYGIKMTGKMEGRCEEMCNLSEAIEERGIKRGKEIGRREGIKLGLQEATEQGIRNLIEVCRECGLSYEETSMKAAARYALTPRVMGEYMGKYWG